MKYLSFDIECCDGQHICEFGYVIIDENFNVLERDCITINPEQKFQLSRPGEESEIKLAFSEEEYRSSPTFAFYYERIKKVLTTPDCQIVGFSLHNDAGFLATAYELYGKEPVGFTFYDFQKLYQAYTKANRSPSVQGFVEELQIEDITLHKSVDDAWAVLRALQIIGEKEKLSLPETLIMLRKCNKNYQAERAKEHNLNLIEKVQNGSSSAQKEFLRIFISNLTVSAKKQEEMFLGKIVCISSHFQKKRFNEFLAIIERLYSYGATSSGKVSECNIFIEYQDGEEEEIRHTCVKQTIEIEKKEIKILTLEQALMALNLTTEDLLKKEYVNVSILKNKREKRKKKGKHQSSYIDKSVPETTLGEILRNQGFDLNAI